MCHKHANQCPKNKTIKHNLTNPISPITAFDKLKYSIIFANIIFNFAILNNFITFINLKNLISLTNYAPYSISLAVFPPESS